MKRETKKRLIWVHLYMETGNAGLVCRKCGISGPTLRKWVRRYKEDRSEGLDILRWMIAPDTGYWGFTINGLPRILCYFWKGS